jgi:hypothetical protein
MRVADAPDPGWFPDPENRTRLRWWDGTDWTDIRRAVPSGAEVTAFAQQMRAQPGTAEAYIPVSAEQLQHSSRGAAVDSQQIIDEVRLAARDEINRAADVFSQRTDAMVRRYTPLVTEYTSRFMRWVKWAVIIAIVLLVAYFVFQVVAQASLFEWIGDRIDNLTDDNNSG